MRPPPLTPLAAAVLRVPPPERVLVLGSGVSEAALFLAREFPAARVRAVDRSEAAVRAAVDRLGLDPEGRMAFKVGGPRALPFPDGFFDLVVMLDARPRAVELARVLRPCGHLLVVRARRLRAAARVQDALLPWRLRRRGIELVESVDAGEGNFLLARLAAEKRGASGN